MFAIGVDIIEVKRIEGAITRWGERFLNRIYTPEELAYCRHNAPSLAARWAAKEAVSKALGTGWAAQEPHEAGWVDWTEIEVVRSPTGQPGLRLHGKAQARSQSLGLDQWQISLSHTAEHAVAMVVAMVQG